MKHYNHIYPAFQLDDIKCEYHDGKRYYVTPEGERYQSITSILSNIGKADIQKWRNRVGEKEANAVVTRASRRGTAVHNICEKYINNEEDALEGQLPHVVELFRSIEPFLEQIDNIRLVEGALWSNELHIAGRADLIAEYEGSLAVIDYKTSTYRKSWEMCHKFFLQGTFYAHAFEERTGQPVENVIIIMAVEGDQPMIIRETKERWLSPLKEVIYKYA